jgi:hypothetical protein
VNSRIINSNCHVFYPSRLLEAGGYCISFVVKGSRYVTTASPLTPQISPIAGSANSILDFCNVRVNKLMLEDRHLESKVEGVKGTLLAENSKI